MEAKCLYHGLKGFLGIKGCRIRQGEFDTEGKIDTCETRGLRIGREDTSYRAIPQKMTTLKFKQMYGTLRETAAKHWQSES